MRYNHIRTTQSSPPSFNSEHSKNQAQGVIFRPWKRSNINTVPFSSLMLSASSSFTLSHSSAHPLSYVWGDANNTRTILVDGRSLAITASLEVALRHLRDAQKDIMICADGICISQSDTEEKSKQVRFMGMIYEMAMHTIVFLGEMTPNNDQIFELFNLSASPLVQKMRSGILSNAQHLPDNKSNIQKKEKIGPNEDLFRHISNMEWFKRVWILQELVLSRDPWVQVASHRLRWDDFAFMILHKSIQDDVALVEYPGYKESPGFKYMNDIEEVRTDFISRTHGKLSEDKADDLIRILHSRRGHGVLDPRDMIYGHLALFERQLDSPEIGRLIEIDHHKPLSEVYSNLALYLLNRQGNFGFLSHVEDVEPGARRPDLTSWVPDWTSSNSSPDAKYHLQKRGIYHPAIPVHLALVKSSVLGCIGTRVSAIESINDFPPISDILALCQKIKDLHLQLPNQDFKQRVYRNAECDRLIPSRGGSPNLDYKVETKRLFHEERKQRKETLMMLYIYLCSWLPGCNRLDFEDDNTSFSRLIPVFDTFYERMGQISKETDFRCLPPLKPYTYWW
ncbi:hypothetical protein EAF04_008980 [Stromatinia cepivora]|nr:hypothetical protein EAF04_008980 [Stromatinia cepivora]